MPEPFREEIERVYVCGWVCLVCVGWPIRGKYSTVLHMRASISHTFTAVSIPGGTVSALNDAFQCSIRHFGNPTPIPTMGRQQVFDRQAGRGRQAGYVILDFPSVFVEAIGRAGGQPPLRYYDNRITWR